MAQGLALHAPHILLTIVFISLKPINGNTGILSYPSHEVWHWGVGGCHARDSHQALDSTMIWQWTGGMSPAG